MKNKLYSLLVGITNYPYPYRLEGCEKDVEKMENYLCCLSTNKFEVQNPVVLLNEYATKNEIAETILKVAQNLKCEDTFLFYFSGHGIREVSEGRFKEDHNGWFETIACYYETEDQNYLLADKELRYLFHHCKSDAHIVTVFDCCHSGDILRGEEAAEAKKKQVRRISAKQSQRAYEDFLFQKTQANIFKDKWFEEIFPDANVLTISACQSDQSSWEGNKGGYFTNALIDALNSHQSIINYNDLAKKIEISIRNKTGSKQTPHIGIIGPRKYNQLTSWLRLNGDSLRTGTGFIQYNKTDKIWIYTKGNLLGIKKRDKITVRIEDQAEIQATVIKVYSDDSIIEVPVDTQFDTDKTYPVIYSNATSKPKIAIYNEDDNNELLKLIKIGLQESEHVSQVEHISDADFQINIFNHCLYYSFPNHPYLPLNQQLKINPFQDKDKKGKAVEEFLKSGNKIISKWHHLKVLEKHDSFTELPILVEIKIKNQNKWIDVTNGNHVFKAVRQKAYDQQLTSPEFEIRVTNKFTAELYIMPLALFHAKLEISSGGNSFFNGITELIEIKKSITFKQHHIWLDVFQEIYNWSEEVAYLKFIVSTKPNAGNITTEITQSGFKPPITHKGNLMGGGKKNTFGSEEKWGVYTTTLQLPNTSYNQISSLLADNLEWYQNNEVVSPFMERLYVGIADLKNDIVQE